jgi:hypothetical protein
MKTDMPSFSMVLEALEVPVTKPWTAARPGASSSRPW